MTEKERSVLEEVGNRTDEMGGISALIINSQNAREEDGEDWCGAAGDCSDPH